MGKPNSQAVETTSPLPQTSSTQLGQLRFLGLFRVPIFGSAATGRNGVKA
jgi:hypothetical protein